MRCSVALIHHPNSSRHFVRFTCSAVRVAFNEMNLLRTYTRKQRNIYVENSIWNSSICQTKTLAVDKGWAGARVPTRWTKFIILFVGIRNNDNDVSSAADTNGKQKCLQSRNTATPATRRMKIEWWNKYKNEFIIDFISFRLFILRKKFFSKFYICSLLSLVNFNICEA